MEQHGVHKDQEMLRDMSDEDAVYVARLVRREKLFRFLLFFSIVIALLMVLGALYLIGIGREYAGYWWLLLFVLIHLYMFRGMFRR